MKKNQTFVDRSDQDVILIGEITIETQGRGMGSEAGRHRPVRDGGDL